MLEKELHHLGYFELSNAHIVDIYFGQAPSWPHRPLQISELINVTGIRLSPSQEELHSGFLHLENRTLNGCNELYIVSRAGFCSLDTEPSHGREQ